MERSGFIILLLFRAFGGPFAAAFTGFAGWVLVWFLFRPVVSQEVFVWLNALLVGLSSGVGAALIWWSLDSSGRDRYVGTGLVLLAGMIGSFLAFQLFPARGQWIWFQGTGSVFVVKMGDSLRPTLAGSVLGANFVGLMLFLFRMLFRNGT